MAVKLHVRAATLKYNPSSTTSSSDSQDKSIALASGTYAKGWVEASEAALKKAADKLLAAADSEARRADNINALAAEFAYARTIAQSDGFLAPKEDDDLDFLHDH